MNNYIVRSQKCKDICCNVLEHEGGFGVGSYENIVKMEEMRKKMEEGDYLSAQKILETMALKKIKHIADLSLVAEVYAQNERYDEAMEILFKIYGRTKTRKVLYQLVSVSINRNNLEDAQSFLTEFEKIAPRDYSKYVFQYKINKVMGEPYEKLIDILETLKKVEYREKWAYELAKIYYKADMEEACIKECSDIVLWFGEGIYVEKAKLLRAYYSGETNKERMIAELKRRASEDGVAYDVKDETIEEKELTETMEEDNQEEKFLEKGKVADFTTHLKNDVQNILSEQKDIEMDEHSDSMNEDAYTKKEAEKYGDAENLIEYKYNDLEQGISENDVAEQEVENTIYRLLREEDMQEENSQLSQMSKELELNLEDLLGGFLYNQTIKKQLVKILNMMMENHTKSEHLIITGTAGSGKTTMAKAISAFLYKSGKLKSPKIAKIRADKLNSIDLMSKKETLKDGCFVVENASELEVETIDKILELIQHCQGNIAVIFEENKKNIHKLFRLCPKLMDLFENRIHIPQYNEDDLLGFAYASFRQQEYQLHPKAQTVLHDMIHQITKKLEDHKKLETICLLTQTAMSSADVRTGKQLPGLAAQGRLQDIEIMTILPEDLDVIL